VAQAVQKGQVWRKSGTETISVDDVVGENAIGELDDSANNTRTKGTWPLTDFEDWELIIDVAP
jgi:hypothetical protein